jgi:hypothetical protein
MLLLSAIKNQFPGCIYTKEIAPQLRGYFQTYFFYDHNSELRTKNFEQ